jgi:hypothetical protein
VKVGGSGSQIGYRSLVAFYTGIFPWGRTVIYEVGSQQFVSCVQLPSVVDLFIETRDQGLVILLH